MKLNFMFACTNAALQTAVGSNIVRLRGFQSRKNNVEAVKRHYDRIADKLEEMDRKMCVLLDEPEDIIEWNVLMIFYCRMLQLLENNLAIADTKQWRWSEITVSIAYLEVVTRNVERLLERNERMQEETALKEG